MDPDEIFDQAIACADPEARRELIARCCRDQPDLQGLVTRLVGAHFSLGNFMAQPAANQCLQTNTLPERPEFQSDQATLVDADDGPIAEASPQNSSSADNLNSLTGRQIGPYLLMDIIGRGGSAVVYRARQEQPLRREVALKLIRPELESDQLAARMQLERQALALMDHAGIAKVFDAGVSEQGRSYYVMELVRGQPITEFCQQHEVDLLGRVRLMLDTCRAVHHAHQRGIIHRDLKPSNLLVIPSEPEPQVKVIDFGIAKRMVQEADDATLTVMGQIIGTPQYMSPEQAGNPDLGVDTRTDVYALGAVLYELLTGQPPIAPGPILQTLERVLSDTPTTPSQLNPSIPLDLETVCMHCLQKAPESRYQSTQEFASDLENVLTGFPVRARPVGRLARLAKWAKRSPGAAALSASTAIATLALIISWAALTWKLKSQHDEIGLQQQQLKQERDFALDNFQRAHQAIKNYLVSFRSHTPLGSSRNLAFQKQMIETGIEFYDDLLQESRQSAELRANPKNLAAVRIDRAELYLEYGKVLLVLEDLDASIAAYQTAIDSMEHLARSVPEHADAAIQKQGVSYTSQSESFRRMRRFKEALETAQKGRQCYERLAASGALDRDYANWYQAITWKRISRIRSDMRDYAASEQALSQALEFSQQLPEIYDFQLSHAEIFLSRSKLKRAQGQYRPALADAETSTKIMEDVCIRCMPSLPRYESARANAYVEQAQCYEALKEVDQAFAQIQSAIEVQRQLSENYPEVEQFSNKLASLYEAAVELSSDTSQQQAFAAQASRIRQGVVTDSTNQSEMILARCREEMSLAQGHRDRMQFPQVVERFQNANRLIERLDAGYQPFIVSSLRKGIHLRLAETHFELLQFDEAETHFAHYAALREHVPQEVRTMRAVCLVQLGRDAQALDLLKSVDADLPNRNYYVAYIPLTRLIARKHADRSADCETEFEGFRRLLAGMDDMSNLQTLMTARALCQAAELLTATVDAPASAELSGVEDQAFANWAQAQAIGCLRRVDIPFKSPLAKSLTSDPRFRCLRGAAQFEALVADVTTSASAQE